MSILKVRMYASPFQSAKKKEKNIKQKISVQLSSFMVILQWDPILYEFSDIPASMISQDICEFQLSIEFSMSFCCTKGGLINLR